MAETQFLLLRDASDELISLLEQDGSIQCVVAPPIHLARTPNFEQSLGGGILSANNIHKIHTSFTTSLTCTYDASAPPCPVDEIFHQLQVVAIALQLVKPTQDFHEYWMKVDDQYGIRGATTLPEVAIELYLRYQQHHTITESDVKRAIHFVPTLLQTLERGHSSWVHPLGAIHRAIILFAQGYSVELAELRQLLWAAGLDCLFASKQNKNLRGAKVISQRLQKLFGSNFNPYTADTVIIPPIQQRPVLRLDSVGEHIFRLRNAYIHGQPIDVGWLSKPRNPVESGYAYQLLECTEILLRITLLRILEDSALLGTFRNSTSLDNYFC